jgi:hypothetical protein
MYKKREKKKKQNTYALKIGLWTEPIARNLKRNGLYVVCGARPNRRIEQGIGSPISFNRSLVLYMNHVVGLSCTVGELGPH